MPRRFTAGPSVVTIGPGLLDRARDLLPSRSGRYVLVTSAGPRRAAERLRERLSGNILCEVEIDDREESKTLAAVERIADRALSAGVRRDDALVAVGGGVVSDVAGFAAAILLRGIPWSAVPTTTGAMADAAIGGKTGVDHREGKNLLGSFHPPAAVVIDPAALEGLPEREYRAGLVEALKAAWIGDAELALRAEEVLPAVLARDEESLLELLGGAAAVKAGIVSADLREGDRRRLLNFGHTLGHAFEAAGGYRDLRHGEAVAWGVVAAVDLSRARAGLPEADAARVLRALARLGPFPRPSVNPGLLRPFLERDKKATARGVAGVLLERIGSARVDEAVPLDSWLDAAARMSIS
ncbi:MAG: 3-dehydroquinate synthase [Acidobacteriota bacterium]|nr:3-dehydroquinate synthase [Acidobacteriota bacterium]